SEWKSSSPPSEKDLFTDLKMGGGGGFGFGGRGNYTRGSIDKGLTAADHQVKATYTIAYIAHVPLEPRAAVAEWKDGRLTVWTGTQRPFRVPGELAADFGVAADR